ncbi:MAG: hypothetical protein ISS89_00455 [Candidatus Omnitrophica bacterium]|nr:hypothetical protein [Candidatus Omnitrophota bacterium]
MSEEIKGLIEKIREEGVMAAEDKARQIEEEARRSAHNIVEKARNEAQKIIADANRQAAAKEASTKALLQQAGRDLMLSLKEEIDSMLHKLIVSEVREALSPDELIRIITMLVKDYSSSKAGADIIIALNKTDCEKLTKGFLGKLKEEARKGIVLKPAEEISGGFIISFDAGKSHYDFTDKALAEYISLYLKPQLAKILEA